MDFKDALIGGIFGAELLGLTENNVNKLLIKPLVSSVSLRFEPITNVLEETVKEAFLDEKKVSEVKLYSKD